MEALAGDKALYPVPRPAYGCDLRPTSGQGHIALGPPSGKMSTATEQNPLHSLSVCVWAIHIQVMKGIYKFKVNDNKL